MRKSEITREAVTTANRCQRESVGGDRCRRGADQFVTVTSFLTDPDLTLTTQFQFCSGHADQLVATYEREWRNHAEYFAG
jgi:hypothetical protein